MNSIQSLLHCLFKRALLYILCLHSVFIFLYYTFLQTLLLSDQSVLTKTNLDEKYQKEYAGKVSNVSKIFGISIKYSFEIRKMHKQQITIIEISWRMNIFYCHTEILCTYTAHYFLFKQYWYRYKAAHPHLLLSKVLTETLKFGHVSCNSSAHHLQPYAIVISVWHFPISISWSPQNTNDLRNSFCMVD